MNETQLNAEPIERLWPLWGSEDKPPVPLDELNRSIRLSLTILHYPMDMRQPTAPLDQDTRAQIRQFQTRIQSTPDGVLKAGEFQKLTRYADLERITELVPGTMMTVAESYVGGYAWAEGTWTMEDLAFPLNYAKIQCRRREGYCEMVSMDFSSPDFAERPLADNVHQLLVDTSTFEIDRWSGGIVEARSIPGPMACRETRITINARTKTAFQSTQDINPNGCEIAGRRLPPMTTPRVATMRDSGEVQREYYQGIRDQLRTVYGPLAPAPDATHQ